MKMIPLLFSYIPLSHTSCTWFSISKIIDFKCGLKSSLPDDGEEQAFIFTLNRMIFFVKKFEQYLELKYGQKSENSLAASN